MTEAERRAIYGNIDRARIKDLKDEIKRLEAENKALRERVEELERRENERSI